MQPIIFFDGVCNLCSHAVQFIIERDAKSQFRFASLQSEFAREQLAVFAIDPEKIDSIALIENGKIYQRSTAALRIAKRLNGLWPMLYSFTVIPRFVRDSVYEWIAKNRYKWFGKTESCWIPTPELKDRFLA